MLQWNWRKFSGLKQKLHHVDNKHSKADCAVDGQLNSKQKSGDNHVPLRSPRPPGIISRRYPWQRNFLQTWSRRRPGSHAQLYEWIGFWLSGALLNNSNVKIKVNLVWQLFWVCWLLRFSIAYLRLFDLHIYRVMDTVGLLFARSEDCKTKSHLRKCWWCCI